MIRDNKSIDADTIVSRTTHPEAGSGPLQPLTNQDAAVVAPSQMLEEMESLESEMRTLLKVGMGSGKLASAGVC